MMFNQTNSGFPQQKLGFHYFPDTLHYTEKDLQQWLPLLMELGVGWLILRTETNRAIPEYFISGLLKAGIQPIIQFPLTLQTPPDIRAVSPLVECYNHWGATFHLFFDRPNIHQSWPANQWAQQDLVERFLDRFLPLASLSVESGGFALFPPLEPGGNFWDTTFLRAALEAIQRRKMTRLLDKLILTAYGWSFYHPLNWGEGGPERWPDARPYFTPAQSQDQRGFRAFEWYSAISEAVLQKKCPIILLQAGLPAAPDRLPRHEVQSEEMDSTFMEIFQLINTPRRLDDEIDPPRLEEEVISLNFWLLSASKQSPEFTFAWFEDTQPIRKAAAQLCAEREVATNRPAMEGILDENNIRKALRPIQHYLYIGENGRSDLSTIFQKYAGFIAQFHPTLGFSLEEARLANRITLAVHKNDVPAELLQALQKQGCQIDWLE